MLDHSQYYHGDSALTVSPTLPETLEPDGVEVDHDSVEIALSDDVIVQSECEAYRFQVQFSGISISTFGLENFSITVNDNEPNGVLSLEAVGAA